jgi:S-adenosylmethionine:tRNA ribosyltransferase-isomerase
MINKIPEIKSSDFTYNLPEDKIAKFPLSQRDLSKLLIFKNNEIFSDIFANIDKWLPDSSLLILNNTKVINARLKFIHNNHTIEIFTLEPENGFEISSALSQIQSANWKCLIGNLKKWKNSELVSKSVINNTEYILKAKLISKINDSFIINFSWMPDNISFAEILEIFGNIPLPPYIKRDSTEKDKLTYQTIFAKNEGSVAAPTASLHFTENVFRKLKEKNITAEYITLNIGAGTFKPVKTEFVQHHSMHPETFFFTKSAVESIIHSLCKKNIIAGGTTVMRAIESLYWFGVQLLQNRFSGENIHIRQWEPFQYEAETSAEAFKAVLNYFNYTKTNVLYGKTNLLIIPGYDFKVFNGLITNFHQPKSTLLMLIAAFIGNKWKRVYEYALKNDFRFLSYGDSSLLFKN